MVRFSPASPSVNPSETSACAGVQVYRPHIENWQQTPKNVAELEREGYHLPRPPSERRRPQPRG